MRRNTFGVSLLLLFLATAAVAQSTSASWRLTATTVNAGGETSVSPSGTDYRLTASAGQESTIGTSSSTDWVLQSGFWSFQGSGLVPVILTMTKNGSVPDDPDLAWTGNDPPYVVYGTGDCTHVTSTIVTTTSSTSTTDNAPPAVNLVCYSVFATAPGPIAPLGSISPSPDGQIEARR